MSERVYVLDASGIIGGFISDDHPNYTTSQVITEIKDIKSRLTLENAMDKKHLIIEEPEIQDIQKISEVITKSGDLLRLSSVDKNVIALALHLKKKGLDPTVITDDYSIQNVLKIIKIPFRSVITRGIEEVVGWIKFCKGCRKIYPADYPSTDCEICGSPISRKRTKKKPENYSMD
ncbi:MAG TPA: ribonuclease VapC [Methanobacterium sp.]|nr:ribonuclease VapC [Methanobacterium sp.]